MEIGELLGQGTYGRVYRIKGTDNVLKKLNIDPINGYTSLEEINFMNQINHPNILKLSSFTIDASHIGFVLPLAQGSLEDIKDFSALDMTSIIYEIISATDFLHKNNFYHCDIKPDNILLINNSAVLADLGLLNKKMVPSKDICQSIKSPQLLERVTPTRLDNFYRDAMKLGKPSNEYQDDIWALGFSIYLILMKRFNPFGRRELKFNDIRSYYNFSVDRVKVLRQSLIPPEYIDLLLKFLNFNPEERSFNLLELLTLPVFTAKKYTSYIKGFITEVQNDFPIIFSDDFSKRLFGHYVEHVNSIKFSTLEKFNCIDLFFRLFFAFKEESVKPTFVNEVDLYIAAMIRVVRKVFRIKEPLENEMLLSKGLRIPPDVLLTFEKRVILTCKGEITRQNVTDFLTPPYIEKIYNWVLLNPEKYEQCSIAKLTQIALTL